MGRPRCQVMGVVNVTPDSFSDGGQFHTPKEAVRRILNQIEDGADIIDLGGESTRPGSVPLTWQEEWARLEPVLTLLAKAPSTKHQAPSPLHQAPGTKHQALPVPLSIDTYHPETAARALDLGASIINCVYEGPVPEMMEICAQKNAELVIPYRLTGSVPLPQAPSTKHQAPIPLYLDPMIGFGTTREEDIALMGTVPEMAKLGRVLVGASRKRLIKKLTGEKMTGKNLGGNVGLAVWAALRGASVVRVHDVKETVQALKVVAALEEADGICRD